MLNQKTNEVEPMTSPFISVQFLIKWWHFVRTFPLMYAKKVSSSKISQTRYVQVIFYTYFVLYQDTLSYKNRTSIYVTQVLVKRYLISIRWIKKKKKCIALSLYPTKIHIHNYVRKCIKIVINASLKLAAFVFRKWYYNPICKWVEFRPIS